MSRTAAANARWASLLVFLLVLGFYLYTLQPSLAWGDGIKLQHEVLTGESFVLSELPQDTFAPDPFPFSKLGVAAWDHPLYVVLGHTTIRLFPKLDPLWVINLHSAVFGAATILVVFQLSHAHTRSIAASLVASLSLAVSHTFWWHSTAPDAHTLFAFLLLLSFFLFDSYERTRQYAALVSSFFVLGLAVSNHLITTLALPAAALYLWLSRRARLPDQLTPGRLLVPGLAFLTGASLTIIQFFRMLRSFSVTEVVWAATGSLFIGQVLLWTRLPILVASILKYLMFLTLQFSPIGVLLGLAGLLAGRRAYGALWEKTFAFYVVFTLFGLFYSVAEQFALFLTSYVFFSLAISMGTAWLASALPHQLYRLLVGVLGLMIFVMPLFYGALPGLARAAGVTDQTLGIPRIGTGSRDGLAYWLNPNKRGDYSASQFGRETLASLPPNSVVITQWWVDTEEYFVLRYFTAIEHMRPDVELVGWPLLGPFNFDARIAVREIERDLPNRPVFLASLSDEYYDAAVLVKKYCIVPEDNLYRVYPESPQTAKANGMSCLAATDP